MKTSVLLFASFAALAASICPNKPGPEDPLSNNYRDAETVIIPNRLHEGEVKAQFETGPIDPCALVPLDAQRITPQPNKTSFEMWTFSTVNLNNISETATIVFYLGTKEALPYWAGDLSAIGVSAALTWADGTRDSFRVSALSGDEGALNLTTDGVNANGTFKSTGASFVPISARLMHGKEIGVTFKYQYPGQGLVAGRIASTAINQEPHFSCSINVTEPQSLEVMPHLGWTNLHADAYAWSEFNIDSRSFNKNMSTQHSISFHDHMWSDRPFLDSVKNWSRGNAHLNVTGFKERLESGYSIVWFQGEDHDGKIHTSSYVVLSDRPQTVCCEKGADKDKVELLILKSNATTVQLTFKLDTGGTLDLNIQKDVLITNLPDQFGRYAGKAKGNTVYEGQNYGVEGVAWFEEGSATG
ncbi:hypothetical protein BDV96DRAFT_684178 [Lophiotrema nucula]|uniref:AsqO/PenF-like C-terminal domain-containing protein n=1 Tax=Lophiotrema nucula TaxID=690887 RepID=A0A6A5ZJR5_9PLEO|nr:hypothetical protein BDV96DRAFT_684178 [Lophiotrema nucula]